MRSSIALAGAVIAASCLYGQSSKLARPPLGYVFDPSAHVLRRIQGIPSAALIGPAVDFGFTISAAYVAPHLDSAFVLARDGRAHFFHLTADAAEERAALSLGRPLKVVFSPSGSAAALYSPGSVQMINGLPDAPVVAGTISPRAPRGEPLAISDDGAYLLFILAGGPLELFGAAGESRQIAASAPGSMAAFAPGSHDAAIIQSGKPTLFQDISGAATQRTLDAIAAPSALAFSPDARKLLVSSASGRSVTVIQVATGERSILTCDCAPASLVPMGPLFRLTELGTAPLWLLDMAMERGLFFVPAPAAP